MQTQSTIDYDTIRYELANGVAHLQLARPERLNALSKPMLLEINEAMTQAEQNADVRVLVLSGAGKGYARNESAAAVIRDITGAAKHDEDRYT